MNQALTARAVARTVLVAVAVVVALYLLWLLRRPISWLLIALFLALALSAPVNRLDRRMPRGVAIALVYLGVLAVPVLLAALLVPSVVDGANTLTDQLPRYVRDIEHVARENPTLREINANYDITGRLQEQAQRLPARIGDAAGVLGDIGLGLVNSVFALVTILVLCAFMLGGGPRWVDAALELAPPDRAERMERVLGRIAGAVSGYMAGAIAIAALAGTLNFVVLSILGVDPALPLAVMSAFFSLIPLVGATIAAVIIGLVTLFNDFPTDTIVWAVWAIVYQQIENNLIQPQVQRRTVEVPGFLVLVAVLFGSALLGVLGALVAIPIAASLLIAMREWWAWRREVQTQQVLAGEPPTGAPSGGVVLVPGQPAAPPPTPPPQARPPGPPRPPPG